jgi:copper chaperone NosL
MFNLQLAGRLPCSAALAATLAVAGCSAPAAGVIQYNVDACDHCRMTIADPRFASQLVTRTGKVYRFDDPRCLASFVAAQRVPPADVHSIWLNDFDTPDRLVRADEALFVVSDRIRAPMNGGAAAFATRADADRLASSTGGRVQSWQEFRKGAS